MTVMDEEGDFHWIDTKAREVYDVTGAGDTVAALFSMGYFAGIDTVKSAEFSNIAAGIVVTKMGGVSTSPAEIRKTVEPFEYYEKRKIADFEDIENITRDIRDDGKKIVFTNGCFDILHIGHIKYLSRAADLGDVLVVGVNSDKSVKKIKGENRPLIDQEERKRILAALECVDYVVIFKEETPIRLIKHVEPDILVKGGDYEPDEVVGREYVEKTGGRVEIVPCVEGISTTEIIEDIVKRFKEEIP